MRLVGAWHRHDDGTEWVAVLGATPPNVRIEVAYNRDAESFVLRIYDEGASPAFLMYQAGHDGWHSIESVSELVDRCARVRWVKHRPYGCVDWAAERGLREALAAVSGRP